MIYETERMFRVVLQSNMESNDLQINDEFTSSNSQEKNNEIISAHDVRAAIVGNVDSGKSTLVGVLTRNMLDNGRGSARSHVFNFNHERANGRTSSIAQELMGFDENHNQVLPQSSGRNSSGWNEIVEKSRTCVTLLDLCGHEKYLRTTLFGLAGMAPDFAIVVVGANAGVLRMTKEHLGVALALQVPIVVVVSKIDFAPEEIRNETLRTLQKILKSPAAGKLPVLVRDESQAETVAASFRSGRVAPIFAVSSVTGVGLPALRRFLSCQKSRFAFQHGDVSGPTKMSIDGVYSVQGVGIVVAGTVLSGVLKPGMVLHLGPDGRGHFRPVVVRSVHHRRVPVEEAFAGNGVSCCIKAVTSGAATKGKDIVQQGQLKKNQIRKGHFLVDPNGEFEASWTFAADVAVLHHATTISPGYQAVVHCGVTRQVARVVKILPLTSISSPNVADESASCLRSGERARLIMRFTHRPELLYEGTPVILREGKTRAVGTLSAVAMLDAGPILTARDVKKQMNIAIANNADGGATAASSSVNVGGAKVVFTSGMKAE